MALPDLTEAKAYLRLDTDVEDSLVQGSLATARALVTQYLRIPLDTESRTFDGRWPRMGPRRERGEQLSVPVVPCDASATVTDVEGTAVDSAIYTIDTRLGAINTVFGESFGKPPYTVAIAVGFAFDPNYSADVEPILRGCILDFVSDDYRRRNPGALYEQSGGQVSITYTANSLPERTKMRLDALRVRWRAW